MERKQQEVAEEYLSSLADLNLNSKPLINMLTILAEENFEYAPVIVKSVEQHIAKIHPNEPQYFMDGSQLPKFDKVLGLDV